MLGEQWKTVAGYEGLYEVSDLGRVRSLDRLVAYKRTGGVMLRRGRLLAGALDKAGYAHLVLCKEGKQKTLYFSRLVAQAFVPNPDNLPDVHHKDFDKTNNSSRNLVWTTHQQNIKHSVVGGRYAKKLNSKVVSEIKTRHRNGESQASIARNLGVRYETVHHVVNGRSWRHVV